ncbi:MAG: thiamine-phosphate kinase [Nitrosarchaeum sp.]|nr:thiamine-phosphate kinase [Nitrosarchaeum sp.]
MTILDETTIIKIFQKKLRVKKFISEDVEVFKIGKTKIVTKVDTFVQSTDMPSKMRMYDAARKSIIACISDFAAKGVKPQYGIISLNLPKMISRTKINEMAKGFRHASNEFGIRILGGDTNEGKEIVINVSIFGTTDKIVKRKGAKVGDIIFVTGPFGYTAAGLKILLGKKKGVEHFVRKAIKSVVNPSPKLEFGVKSKKYFTSSMDSSDGLSTTLNEMANQSKCKFMINNIPTGKDLLEFAKSYNIDSNDLVFHGGEEYEFVFTASKKHRSLIKKDASILKTPIIEIGYVTKGKGVFLEKQEKFVPLKDLGWHHFRK